MTLYVHRSNRVEDLGRELARVVETSFPDDPFVPLPIVVGSRGMERWLRETLAANLGAVIGVDFPFPKPAFDGAARVLLQDAETARAFWRRDSSWMSGHERWSGAVLTFRVLKQLRAFADDDDFVKVRAFIEGGVREPGADATAVTARELGFATEVADVLNKLMHHRAAEMVTWEERPAEAPQQHLWLAKLLNALAKEDRGSETPARLHEALAKAPPRAMRQRVCVFGLSTLGPGDKQRIEVLARSFDVHLFLLVPSSVWWGDLRSRFEARRARAEAGEAEGLDLEAEIAGQNALLAGLGLPSRDVQTWLESTRYQEIERTAEGAVIEAVEGVDGVDGVGRSTLLSRIQDWIDAAGAMPVPGEGAAFERDGSVSFHAAYGAMRQCEALRDALLARFLEDPTLEPRDVLVMTPDVATYAPLVAAVFSRQGARHADGSAGAPAIPTSIADLGLRLTNPVAEVLVHALSLARERVTASALLGFIGLGPVRERFRLTSDDLNDLHELVASSGMRWGWDAADRERHEQPSLDQNTVRFALERLAMGVLMPAVGPLEVVGEGMSDDTSGVVPVPLVTRDRVRRFGVLARVCRSLEGMRDEMLRPGTAAQWRARLEGILEQFSVAGTARAEVEERLSAALPDYGESSDAEGLRLDRDAVMRLVEGSFEDKSRGDRPISGAVTVCALEPMRSVPFRVIVLLGMEHGLFPRASRTSSWDPFHERRKGELDRREIDRHLILEALLSARDALMVFWTGYESKRGKPQPASVVVEELMDIVGRLCGVKRDALVTRHPLQPWSRAGFGESGSFDAMMARAASVLAQGRPEAAGLAASSGEVLRGDDAAPTAMTADDLARAIAEPQKHLLKGRLGLMLDPREVEIRDREPIELDDLDRWQVRSRLVDELLAPPAGGADGADNAEVVADVAAVAARTVGRFAAEGALPLARAGVAAVATEVETVKVMRQVLIGAAGTRKPGVEVSWVAADGLVLSGRAPTWRSTAEGMVLEWAIASKAAPKRVLVAWVNLLLAKVVRPDEVVGARLVGSDCVKGGEPVVANVWSLNAPDVDEARRLLEDLVLVWRELRSRPMPLFPSLSPTLVDKLGVNVEWDAEWVDKEGDKPWEQDLEDVWVASLFEGKTLGAVAEMDGFEALAKRVWGPMFAARVRPAGKSNKKGGAS